MEDTGRSETSADAMTNNNGHTYLDRSTGRELDQRTNHDPGARLAQAYPLLPPHRYGETSCLVFRCRLCLRRGLIPAIIRVKVGWRQLSPVQSGSECEPISRSPRSRKRPYHERGNVLTIESAVGSDHALGFQLGQFLRGQPPDGAQDRLIVFAQFRRGFGGRVRASR